MDNNSVAWAAGVFEGEGSVAKLGPPRADGSQRWCIAITMTDEDVIRRVAETFQAGRVYGPYRPKGTDVRKRNYQPVWKWTVSNRTEFEKVAPLLLPWLGQRRRERMTLAMSTWGSVIPKYKRVIRPFEARPASIRNPIDD